MPKMKLDLAMSLTPTASLHEVWDRAWDPILSNIDFSKAQERPRSCRQRSVFLPKTSQISSGGMSSTYPQQTPPSPPESPSEATVEVYALSAGHFSLPERFFVHPASPSARRTVPSLSFLVVHHDQETGRETRIVFDLGLRRDLKRYPEPIQKHVETRQPMTTLPDVTASLAAGGLAPGDIDYVIYSHVSTWRCPDHLG
jgi:hypothetical protein